MDKRSKYAVHRDMPLKNATEARRGRVDNEVWVIWRKTEPSYTEFVNSVAMLKTVLQFLEILKHTKPVSFLEYTQEN